MYIKEREVSGCVVIIGGEENLFGLELKCGSII
jgi:hypothetical protein